MSYYDYQTSNDGSYATLPDGSTTWSEFTSYEWWETFGPEGRAYSTAQTRDGAIGKHKESNQKLTDAAEEINKLRRKCGEPDDYEIELTPISGVRHAIRWQSMSGFERFDQEEKFDGDAA